MPLGRSARRACAAVAGALVVAACGPAAIAGAAERVVAVPQSQYATTNVAIDQGEPLTFLNLDAINHDVTARGKNAAGAPLFSSPLIGFGQEVPVTGADTLSPGSYAFVCSIHSNMDGTLTVGGGGSGGGDDGEGPAIEVQVLDSKLSDVRKAGILRVAVTVDEASSMAVSASAKIDGEKAKLGKASHDFDQTGSHVMEIKLSKSGKSALRGEDKVKVRISAKAEDTAGNKSSAKDKATLR